LAGSNSHALTIVARQFCPVIVTELIEERSRRASPEKDFLARCALFVPAAY